MLIANETNSLLFKPIRGDLPVDVVLDHWEMYRKKNPFFKVVMRRWGKMLKSMRMLASCAAEDATPPSIR